ncbi:hypothetical protein GCM10010393_57800 [Streptomyces gobitricini]|uniref:Uncharacterized protein n=1 Tax=Streptomyces gobitricini TaxID=68211 RepID=A0ABN3N9U9_9ACTN
MRSIRVLALYPAPPRIRPADAGPSPGEPGRGRLRGAVRGGGRGRVRGGCVAGAGV